MAKNYLISFANLLIANASYPIIYMRFLGCKLKLTGESKLTVKRPQSEKPSQAKPSKVRQAQKTAIHLLKGNLFEK